MMSCLAPQAEELQPLHDNLLFDAQSAASAAAGTSALDWAFLPAHLLDIVILNLAASDPATEIKTLFAVVGTCSCWRSAVLPALLSKMWKQKKVVHFHQLFIAKPHDASTPLPPMLRCVIKRQPSTSPLDSPTYELWQAESERDLTARFLLSARVNKHSNFTISVNRAARAGSPAAVDSECAELVTNIKRTEYELHWCRKSWVRQAYMQLTSASDGAASSGAAAGSGVWQQRLSSSLRAMLGLKPSPAPSASRAAPPPPDDPQAPLLCVRYYMRMHGLLLPRRLVVEVAQPPPAPSALSTNPLFDKRNSSASPGSSCDLDAVKDQDQGQDQGQGQARSQWQPSATRPSLRITPSSTSHAPRAAQAPEALKLQNVLPHWSPQLKCWCLNFNNRVKLPSIKNFQLGPIRASSEPLEEGGRQVQQPILLQFGKVDTDIFVLDFQPTAMTAVQAFGMGLSSFERKYSLY